jgi:hypothetical protein
MHRANESVASSVNAENFVIALEIQSTPPLYSDLIFAPKASKHSAFGLESQS